MIKKIESQEIDGVISIYYQMGNNPKTKAVLVDFVNLLTKNGIEEDLPRGVIGTDPNALPTGRKVLKSENLNLNIISSEFYIHIIASFKKEMKDMVSECMQTSIDALQKST